MYASYVSPDSKKGDTYPGYMSPFFPFLFLIFF
jgi:hypothetical protein